MNNEGDKSIDNGRVRERLWLDMKKKREEMVKDFRCREATCLKSSTLYQKNFKSQVFDAFQINTQKE